MVFREAASAIKLLDNFLGNIPCLDSYEVHTSSSLAGCLGVKLIMSSSTCQKAGAGATGGAQPATPSTPPNGGLDQLLGGLLGSGAAKPSGAAPTTATKRP